MLTLFNQKHIDEFTNTRKGEVKLGECVSVLNPKKTLKEGIQNTDSTFVIFGVPEDIGVKMNGGNGGAHTSFIPAIKAFLNTQQNQFIKGDNILILGYLDFFDDVIDFDASDHERGDLLVKSIDKKVANLVNLIIESGKIPIIIGGGHNNAYGNIKGLSSAKKSPINVINLDAHSDLRRLEERHSGNGFSYALEEGFLDKYFMFGLHESYTPQYIFEKIHNSINLDYNTFEELEVYQVTNFKNELQRASNFIQDNFYGIEIDLDCIQYFPSSAMTPSGFTPQQTRQFVYNFAKNNKASYIHICEGAPVVKNEPTTAVQVGKFISYLISDFIKAKEV
ncbi:formiminoglutamase [Tenacibaculum sp. MAR_2009_124]|uniref:formimidoylglutamase n=1 Tax=Tenacibaculum sp. MAR_2009_124 TaxID=1250059 RepID=UPI0008974948|nr:formimidoylglutamase [Tenacibaculum sp. MAR_2009_124]SEB53007.1 formiminoglutamase [Tenacibaculum sp. MAR_2009_124]